MNFVLLVRNMRPFTRVPEFFRQPKVYNVDEVGLFTGAHDKVAGFYIAMQQGVCMNILNSINLTTTTA